MNTEIQFFMNDADEGGFLEFASGHIDRIEEKSDTQRYLHVGEHFIQFLNWPVQGDILLGGRIAIRTNSDTESARRAERVFNKLRRWIRKHFTNNVTCRNINVSGSQSKTKSHWIGPNTIELLKVNPTLQLKQSHKGYVVFELSVNL